MNPKNRSYDPSRRKFLGACCAAVGATGLLSTLAQLRLLSAGVSPENGPLPRERQAGIAQAIHRPFDGDSVCPRNPSCVFPLPP